ncbi:unnamed protein product [Heligmosomoides polygyrus]|uniref:Reverse transcriptase domain-containing protein n=1 Tax=Heligmosomoides polygyrus TaxID=6339 RepID=A0A183FYB9_HELPZ|nr:unnamed protein product [Heligmosomoides polygyrus]
MGLADEGQPCEQTGFRRGFSTINNIHTITKLIEVLREYKLTLRLTFVDLKRALPRLKRALQCITSKISPFYNDVVINVKRRVRQGDTISLKLFTFENNMCDLVRKGVGEKVDGRKLHHLRFADDIVLMTPSISQTERMLANFDCVYGNVGLQLNPTKTICVHLGHEVNMANDLAPKLGKRKRAAWRAFKSVEEVAKETKNVRLRAHLFDSTVLPALTYASETWAIRRKQDEHAQRGIERTMLGVT